MSNFYEIAVNFPKAKSVLTYKGPANLPVGSIVDLPLGKRTSTGVIVNATDTIDFDEKKVKEITGVTEGAFALDDIELNLYQWMSKYYHYSLGKLIFDCLPKILKRPMKAKFIQGQNQDLPFELNEKQLNIFQNIEKQLPRGFSQHFIHGVTGSGKSLIYLSLIKKVLDGGKSAQFLLPEINLTPQFTEMFEQYLGYKVLAYHSGVTPSQKFHIWNELKNSDDPVLVLGVRSSIFLPIKNIGIIVVDEEHDSSFKQSDRCPYNGRDVAIKKAQLHSCPVVLGTATPTMENFYLFSKEEGKRNYYQIPDRVNTGYFPKLSVLSTRDEFKGDDNLWPLLPETIDKIQKKLEQKEQVLVFINKLGFASLIQCRGCGHQFKNEECGCDNNLRYFKKKNMLSCAHCEYKVPLPDRCPNCSSVSLLQKGFGTERVQELLQGLFPGHTVDRFDRDEIKNVKQLNQKLQDFHTQKIDVLVGTQMLSKGHNFEKVNLVVILGLDNQLNFADFRSTEKTYQLAMQVSGRAGRYSKDSEVVVQTLNPDHSLFSYIQNNSLEEFYQDELGLREICNCPPFTKLAMVFFSSRFRERLIDTINNVSAKLRKLIEQEFDQVQLLGPTPSVIEKKANQFTWCFMLKTRDINQLHNLLDSFVKNYVDISGVSYKIDVDPNQVL